MGNVCWRIGLCTVFWQEGTQRCAAGDSTGWHAAADLANSFASVFGTYASTFTSPPASPSPNTLRGKRGIFLTLDRLCPPKIIRALMQVTGGQKIQPVFVLALHDRTSLVLKGLTVIYCDMQWCQAVPSLGELAQWVRKGFRAMVREQPAECSLAPQPTLGLTPNEALHQIVTAEIALRGWAPLKPKGGKPGEGEHCVAIASLIPLLEAQAHALGFLSLPITQTATARLLKGLLHFNGDQSSFCVVPNPRYGD
jgi:hypothetical protein